MIVHRSDRVEVLAERLTDLTQTPPADPLAPEIVVVDSRGMARWLGFRLAQRLPVCAHFEWPSPGRFLYDCFEAVLGPDAVDFAGWSADRLLWAVAQTLPTLTGRPDFAHLAAYLGGDAPGARKPVLLAREIGRAFARYVRYRPDLLRAWDDGAGDGWQPALWRALPNHDAGAHLARVADRFAARVGHATAALPARVSLFGLTTLPPLYTEALRALGRHVPVHIFALTPTLATEAHPLYASNGRLFMDLGASLADAQTLHDDFAEPDATTLLGALQADLVAGRVRPHVLGADGSVQIHACHGPMRQVEVLRDALVSAFDALPDLQPRDVLVMTPDIDTYAPLVHAVFADETPGVPPMPFRVADRAARHGNLVGEALLATLALVGGRAEASTVTDLLATGPVHRRFGVDPDDLPRVRGWIADCGIHWGIDADHRAAWGQPPDATHTWRAGTDRMLLGRAMAGDWLHLYGGTLPYDDVQGRDTLVLGRVVDFLETLFERLRAMADPRPMAEWSGALTTTLDALFASGDTDASQHVQLREIITQMVRDAAAVGADLPVSVDAISALIAARLDDRGAPTGFLSGAMTFCELVPMRSIPFRVIALVGMDDGAFPRSATRPGFDLVDREPRAGDRSRRDDDRALFLEAVLAARDRLLVTYTGRDIHGNRTKAPAVPIGELIDVLAATFPGVELRREHPLQAFSPRNFDAAGPRSYDRGALRAAAALSSSRREPPAAFFAEPLPPPEPAPIDLDLLCRFFEGPARALLGRRLGLWYRSDEDPISDARPLDLDGLARWKLGDTLLGLRLKHPGLNAFEAMMASGLLPPGPPGREAYDRAERTVGNLVESIERARAGAAFHPIDVDLEIPSDGAPVRLIGRVDHLYPGGRVHHQFSRVQPKHLVSWWVRHVVLHVAAGPGSSILLGRPSRGEGVRTERLGPIPLEAARTCLLDLLSLYAEGQRTALPFFPATSRAWMSRLPDRAAAAQAARAAWYRERDAYYDRAFGLGDTPPPASAALREDFATLARRIWTPFDRARGRA